MDSAASVFLREDLGCGDAEKTQDNTQLSLDAGRRDEIDDNEPKSLIMELYPWMQQFKKMCRSSLFQPSMTSLKHLMTYYMRNVRLSVNECYTKPLRAEKLKDSISETLLFFLYFYREIGEDHDRASYMDLMTDLLAMYIDMELKASKKGKEDNSKIAARLTSCLHVYLDHSAEHLLDTLLKVHFMTHNYHEILDPVITKIFKGIQEHPNSSIMYVRYFLAYRLWKKLNKDVAVRNQINVAALASLGAAPNDFPQFIIESVLPKVPNSQKLSTKSLLLHKFDVDKSCEEFFKFCKRERGLNAPNGEQITCPTNTAPSPVNQLEDNDAVVSIVHNNVVNVSNDPQVNSSSPDSLNNETVTGMQTVSFLKAASPLKLSSLRKAKKSNDIVIIDLTSDNVTEKVIRQKKTRRKLCWLEEAKKRINTKIVAKKTDSATEDLEPVIHQLEDIVNLDSLRIESPRCGESLDMEIMISDERKTPEDVSLQERTIPENASLEEKTIPEDASLEEKTTPEAEAEVSEGSTPEQVEFTTTSTLNDSEENCSLNDCNQQMVLEIIKNSVEEKVTGDERAEVPEVAPSSTDILTTEAETTVSVADNSSRSDELLNDNKINDKRASPLRDIANVRDNHLESIEFENNKGLEVCPEPNQLAIKAEHIADQSYEIINEKIVTSGVEVPIADIPSRVSLEIGCNEEILQAPECSRKIRESEFQDNIDGLSLLASVSQRISHLTTPQLPRSHPVNGELIKVKNYASLANSSICDEPVTSSDALPQTFCSVNTRDTEIVNRVVGIYPEEALDKVAYQVEVTSTGDVVSYEDDCDEALNGVVPFQTNNEESCRNNLPQATNVVPVESTTQAEKDDTNVILNGETVVLFQKSPNSNLYIINKAVENRDHGNDELSNGIRDIPEHANESAAFSYEFPYDNVYRSQPTMPYDLTPYNRDVSAQDGRRCKKVVAGGDSAVDANKTSDTMELAKSGKLIGLNLDVIGKGATGKRTSSSNTSMSRRRRIKQEYNGCGSDLPSHITPNYGIQECSQEHVESSRSSIHIPVTHSSSLSSIYSTYTGGAELYLPCHKNCNSMTCGLPINSKASTGGKGHCSCLNCTYGIVAHCGECILPNNEPRSNSIENSSYYLPIHSGVQPSPVQDCGGQDTPVKMFDDQLVCKLEKSLLNSKPLDSVAVKCETKEIYRAELDNKLPLKKRFKAMMSLSFEEMSIKREKTQSYPGTPMISIAALDSQHSPRTGCTEGSIGGGNSLELSLQERAETHHNSEMIRRDYRKDMMMMLPPPPPSSSSTPNGYRNRGSGNSSSNSNGANSISNNSLERKRKRRTAPHALPSCNVDNTRHEASYQKINKTPVKHKDTTTTTGVIVSKRLTAPNKSHARPSEKVKEPDAAQSKNSTRQTRSSKRNIPKVNYIYADGDSDWNPSGGGSKKKRKKTSR